MKIKKEELKKILEDHKKWIKSEPGGSFADLRRADLFGANLRGVDISCADLRGADLRGADLRDACLRGADLRGAHCMVTIFANADLRGADLRGANLWRADTHEMKTDEKTKIDWPMVCPETGSFIAWKKAGEYIVKLEIPDDEERLSAGEYIVKLEIPADAERSSATTKKCRASMARVLEIQNVDGTNADITMARSCWRKVYKPGEMVYPDKWDNNRWNECSHGIHFFMTRDEAVEW